MGNILLVDDEINQLELLKDILEFNLLPNGSYCKEVRISIVHRGNRIAFETAESATKLATLNQIQNILVGFGLNKTGWELI